MLVNVGNRNIKIEDSLQRAYVYFERKSIKVICNLLSFSTLYNYYVVVKLRTLCVDEFKKISMKFRGNCACTAVGCVS